MKTLILNIICQFCDVYNFGSPAIKNDYIESFLYKTIQKIKHNKQTK